MKQNDLVSSRSRAREEKIETCISRHYECKKKYSLHCYIQMLKTHVDVPWICIKRFAVASMFRVRSLKVFSPLKIDKGWACLTTKCLIDEQNHNVNIFNESFESVAKLFLVATQIRQNYILTEINRGLNSWFACYHPSRDLLYFLLRFSWG
jgi:hypothetical protein